MTKQLDVSVSFVEGRGFTAQVPGRRTQIIAVSLIGIRQRVEWLNARTTVRLHLDPRAKREMDKRKSHVRL